MSLKKSKNNVGKTKNGAGMLFGDNFQQGIVYFSNFIAHSQGMNCHCEFPTGQLHSKNVTGPGFKKGASFSPSGFISRPICSRFVSGAYDLPLWSRSGLWPISYGDSFALKREAPEGTTHLGPPHGLVSAFAHYHSNADKNFLFVFWKPRPFLTLPFSF